MAPGWQPMMQKKKEEKKKKEEEEEEKKEEKKKIGQDPIEQHQSNTEIRTSW